MIAPGFAGLDFHAWLTVAVVVVLFGALAWERLSPAVLLVIAVAVLFASGVLTLGESLAGFVNQAVLTVAALFIVAGALRTTGAIRWLASWVLGRPHGAFVAQARLTGIAAGLSAFINNTPVVAMLTAAVEDWCRSSGVSASKLLIPLSYATILGGMCTLIGTSTNLIVLGLMQQHGGLPHLHMFDPLRIGLPAVVVGLAYLLTAGRWLLPARRRTALEQAGETEAYVLQMEVTPDGPLDGCSVREAGLRKLSGAYLIEVKHQGVTLPAVSPDTVLAGGDRLVFVGTAAGLQELRQMAGVDYGVEQGFAITIGDDRHFVEVVLSRFSPVLGGTLRDADFRARYGAVVVAINRRGRQLLGTPGTVVLQAGDTLLLETTPQFARRYGQSHEFAMVNPVDATPAVQPRKAIIALGVLAAMVVANAVFGVNILLSAALAALAVWLSGCMRWREACRAVDIPLIVTIACALAIGIALSKTGVARAVAGLLMQWGGGDPFLTLALVYVLTVGFTELLTNNAAAVLAFPIGLAASHQLGTSPMPFIMVVMIGASASFITPIGYQTNMMVYGPGGYRFMDYVRVGTPLSILVGVVVLLVTPHVWPF